MGEQAEERRKKNKQESRRRTQRRGGRAAQGRSSFEIYIFRSQASDPGQVPGLQWKSTDLFPLLGGLCATGSREMGKKKRGGGECRKVGFDVIENNCQWGGPKEGFVEEVICGWQWVSPCPGLPLRISQQLIPVPILWVTLLPHPTPCDYLKPLVTGSEVGTQPKRSYSGLGSEGFHKQVFSVHKVCTKKRALWGFPGPP